VTRSVCRTEIQSRTEHDTYRSRPRVSNAFGGITTVFAENTVVDNQALYQNSSEEYQSSSQVETGYGPLPAPAPARWAAMATSPSTRFLPAPIPLPPILFSSSFSLLPSTPEITTRATSHRRTSSGRHRNGKYRKKVGCESRISEAFRFRK
jgi:hypothetical protein